MVRKKGTTIRGKSAKRKGSVAERKVRDLLRTIYPRELRDRVYRVPMSGAGPIKGDVVDNNDYDSCYEVKCQETMVIQDWWRQTKSQAGTSRTPVLVVTQAYRPFYFILREDDWLEMVKNAGYKHVMGSLKLIHTGQKFFDDMAELVEISERCLGNVNLDGDSCCVVSTYFYLEVKKALFLAQNSV